MRQEVLAFGHIGCVTIQQCSCIGKRRKKLGSVGFFFFVSHIDLLLCFSKVLVPRHRELKRTTNIWVASTVSGDLTEQQAQGGRDVDTYHADWSTFQAVYIQQRVSNVYVFVSKLTLLHYWLAQMTFTVVNK